MCVTKRKGDETTHEGFESWVIFVAYLFLFVSLPLIADTFKNPASTFNMYMNDTPVCGNLFRGIYRVANPEKLGISPQADNQNFIDLVAKPEGRSKVYLHVTLKVLKPLNDRVFADEGQNGKEDVNSVRNIYRILLIENLQAHPELSKALVGIGDPEPQSRFLDFKTAEFAFDPALFTGGEALMMRQLDGVLVKTGLQFEAVVMKVYGPHSDLIANMAKEHGLVSDLNAWHLAGVAKGHPDAAAFAARRKASHYNPEKVNSMNVERFSETDATELVARIESDLRPKLLASIGQDSPVFAKDFSGQHVIMSKDSIDVLRKVDAVGKEDYIKKVQAEFNAKLKVQLTREQVLGLRDYYALVDTFSPSIRAAERTQIDLTKAKQGKISVDFAGQNVENIFQTMSAVAEAHAASSGSSGRRAIELSRVAEGRATKRLAELKEYFAAAAKLAGITGKVEFSGDDGELILEKPLSDEQWTALHRALERGVHDEKGMLVKKLVSEFRIVHTPPIFNKSAGIDPGEMSRETVKGEDFEKRIRRELYETMDGSRVKSLGLASRLNPTSHTFELTLVGGWTAAETEAVRQLAAEKGFSPLGYRLGRINSVRQSP